MYVFFISVFHLVFDMIVHAVWRVEEKTIFFKHIEW